MMKNMKLEQLGSNENVGLSLHFCSAFRTFGISVSFEGGVASLAETVSTRSIDRELERRVRKYWNEYKNLCGFFDVEANSAF